MIDLHTHVLSGIDDGARDVEESVRMADLAAADGVRVLAATPHIRQDYAVEISELPERVERLNREIERCGVNARIVSGGEVAMTKLPSLDDNQLRAVSLGGGSRYLLVECPYGAVPPGFDQALFGLVARGFVPIIAHPERNAAIRADAGRLTDLVRSGALVQITASSLTGEFGGAIQRFAFDLVRSRVAHSIGSDSHGPTRRPPLLSGARDALAAQGAELADQADWMTVELPEKVLADAPIDPPNLRVPARRGIASLFKRRRGG